MSIAILFISFIRCAFWELIQWITFIIQYIMGIDLELPDIITTLVINNKRLLANTIFGFIKYLNIRYEDFYEFYRVTNSKKCKSLVVRIITSSHCVL